MIGRTVGHYRILERGSNVMTRMIHRPDHSTTRDTSTRRIPNRLKWFLVAVLVSTISIRAAEWHVKAGAESPANGSKDHPFATLAQAEAASAPGDTIVVLPAPLEAGVLDGGIRLKKGQKLVGAGPDPLESSPDAQSRITNRSASANRGHAVILASGCEVRGLVITETFRSGILGLDVTDVRIEGNLITGWNQSRESFAWSYLSKYPVQTGYAAVVLENWGVSGKPMAVTIVNNRLESGLAGGVFISNFATSEIHIRQCTIRDLNPERLSHRADGILSLAFWYGPKSTTTLSISDTFVADVASRAECGFDCSDGITTLSDHGTTTSLEVDRYRFDDSKHVGGKHSQGVETVTLGAGQTRLRLQNSDITNAAGPGVVVWNPTGRPPSDIVDLGGGALGSVGNNRFLDNYYSYRPQRAEVFALNGEVTARNNWWGTPSGARLCSGPDLDSTMACVRIWKDTTSTIDVVPFLTEDPRPGRNQD